MSMASDELAERIRTLVPRGVQCVEKKMFGGIAFMVDGNMLVAPMKAGELIVRVGKAGMADALSLSGAELMDMKGRSMSGFVVVSGDALEDDEALQQWIDRAWDFVRTLPAKP